MTFSILFSQLYNMDIQKRALVLFSGGQDSTICLAYALKHYHYVETIGFDYGQNHKIELTARQDVLQSIRTQFPEWAQHLKEDHLLYLPALSQIGGNSLVETNNLNADQLSHQNHLPDSFVPARNVLFLTYAAALAYRRSLDVLIGGMCETDFSGYPDCRRDSLDSLETTLDKSMQRPISIITPLMFLDKSQSWEMAQKQGGDKFIDLIIKKTHSCYQGNHTDLHEWGYGCNTCPACQLRKQGFTIWKKEKQSDEL